MDYATLMAELKKMGTAQNVKIYKRHGAGDNVFGVSFANLGKLKKKIKTDHALAEKLWASGNTDARSLATMIADPQQIAPDQVEKWTRGVQSRWFAQLLSGLLAQSLVGRAQMRAWMKAPEEFTRQLGYNVFGACLKERNDISDDDCRRVLHTIEKEIHSSPNFARHAMNGAVIAVGIYRPSLTQEAIAAAKRIGKVEVNHGETDCQTPGAVAYIEKAVNRGGRVRLVAGGGAQRRAEKKA